MAHQIETHGSEAAAIFARTDAWHRLGTTVRDRAFTAEEAMTLGHLGGWRVRKAPLIAHEVTADGVTTIDAPGYATVRDNPFTGRAEALGVVGAGYEPLQNEDHAEFLNNLADQSGAVFDTAGSLRGGRQVFITMQLPDSLTIGGTDAVDLNIAALNSHDGSGAFRILVTPVRVVCANTQAAALAAHASSFSIRHTRNAKAAVAAARDALGLTFSLRRGVRGRGRAAHPDDAHRRRVRRPHRGDVRHRSTPTPASAPSRPTPTGRTSCRSSSTTPTPRPASEAPRGPATKPWPSTSTTTPPCAPSRTPPPPAPAVS